MGFQSAFELEIACYAVVVNPPLTYHRAMGIYDREYFRQPARRDSFARVPALSVTMWLIVINVAIFFIDGISKRTMPPQFPPEAMGRQGLIPMSCIDYWRHVSPYTVSSQ